MGNGQSSPPPPPNPAPPQPVVNLSLQKVPVVYGSSGLHYSGRIYSNEFQQSTTDSCPAATVTPDQINDVMPNSISTTILAVDDSTKRINADALTGYVQSLVSSNQIPGQKGDVDSQQAADAAFYTAIQGEFCFYQVRYTAALNQFLTLVADPNGADSSAALASTIALNKRLNSLLEIMNHVANDRAAAVNQRGPLIDNANAALQTKIETLKEQQIYLTTGNVRSKTQEEMLRFSAEKSRAMNIQIVFFVILNVVALGTIITVYKGTKPMA